MPQQIAKLWLRLLLKLLDLAQFDLVLMLLLYMDLILNLESNNYPYSEEPLYCWFPMGHRW